MRISQRSSIQPPPLAPVPGGAATDAAIPAIRTIHRPKCRSTASPRCTSCTAAAGRRSRCVPATWHCHAGRSLQRSHTDRRRRSCPPPLTRSHSSRPEGCRCWSTTWCTRICTSGTFGAVQCMVSTRLHSHSITHPHAVVRTRVGLRPGLESPLQDEEFRLKGLNTFLPIL